MDIEWDKAASDVRALSAATLRRLVDWVVPPRCLGCTMPLIEPASLCAACWAKLDFIEAPCCDRLGAPFPYDQGEGMLSPAALADPPEWDRARAAVAYDDVSRAIVQDLKYRDRHEAALFMARLMVRAGASLVGEADAVVPVPLHRWRLWRRRFNQSALLARHISGASGLDFRPDLLERIKPTRPQVGLNHAARRDNVRKAFAVPAQTAPDIYGKSIVLVDDVMTTGATAEACARVLRKAGARRIAVLTFALVLEPRRLHI